MQIKQTIAETPEKETTAEYIAMKESVQKNKGFYIARYEAGKPDGKTSPAVDGMDKPVSKKV